MAVKDAPCSYIKYAGRNRRLSLSDNPTLPLFPGKQTGLICARPIGEAGPVMDFEFSERSLKLRDKLIAFMDEHVYPNELTYHEQHHHGKSRWQIPPIMDEL